MKKRTVSLVFSVGRYVRETVGKRDEHTAVGGCQVFHIFHADDALQGGELDGFVCLFFLRLDGGHALLLEDFGQACVIVYVL